MQTIKTNGREIVAVEVPEGSSDFFISSFGILCGYNPKRMRFVDKHKLHSFDVGMSGAENYKIIGLLSELTAEQCEPYAPTDDVLKEVNAKEKFILLLAIPYCLDTTKPLLIIEKLK